MKNAYTLIASSPKSDHPFTDRFSFVVATICFLVGSLQVIAIDNMFFLWLSMFVLSTAAFACLYKMLTDSYFVTQWSVYATAIGLGYGFGALNTMLRGYSNNIMLLEVTYARIQYVALAEGLILLLFAGLIAVGVMDKKKMIPQVNISDADRRATLFLMALGAMTAMAGVASGNIGYGGGQGSEEGTGRVSPIGALLVASMTSIFATGLFVFAKEQNKKIRIFAFSLCAMLLGPILLGGRRSFVYAILVGTIAFFASRGTKNFFTKKLLVFGSIAIAAIMFIVKFYFAMRLASYKLEANPILSDLIVGAWDIMMNAEAEGLDAANSENQGTRTFIIGYLAELLQAGAWHKTTLGDLLLVDIATTIPTTIWPGKWAIMGRIGSEEAACHAAFGIPGWDAANTSATAGLCDFWIPGLFLYPLGAVFVFAMVGRILWRAPILVRLLVCFTTTENLFQVENTLTGYLSGLRNILIVSILAFLITVAFRYYESLPLVQHSRAQKALRKQRIAELRKGAA